MFNMGNMQIGMVTNTVFPNGLSVANLVCYYSVLFKCESFMQVKASCLPLSFHQKRGTTERGWVQNTVH